MGGKDLPEFRSFTSRFIGRASQLITDVIILPPPPSPAKEYSIQEDKATHFKAVWDTGASSTAITQRVVDELKLAPTGMRQVHTASGTVLSESYAVAVALPNRVIIPLINATKSDLGNCAIDVLIGMDVIGQGDFAVTEENGCTVMSYRWPHCATIDYNADAENIKLNRALAANKQNRHKQPTSQKAKKAKRKKSRRKR